MNPEAIAVLDVGKTNKKVLLYDLELNLLEISKAAFPEEEKDGLMLEKPKEIFDWFCESLLGFSSNYDIKAISVTTHGATVVCVDDKGNISAPPLSYTNTTEPGFADEFFNLFGSREHLQQTTGTAEIGELINTGKMIYYLKKNFPDDLQKTRWILHYPQYFVFMLTGIATAEPTMLGCHSYLFDPAEKAYSEVAHKLGIVEKLSPAINKSWETAGPVTPEIIKRTGVSDDCVVTLGVHDSNSSLIPYLISQNEKFVLNSTGTWCVAMSPAERISFDNEELGKLVFYNMDIFNDPVKTSIFMGGEEYQTYMELFNERFPNLELPEFNAELYASVLEQCNEFILPSVTRGAGIFPHSTPRLLEADKTFTLLDIKSGKPAPGFMDNFERSCAILIYSLAIQTTKAFEYVGMKNGDTVFVEGGFRLNQPYLAVLNAIYPASKVYTTDLKEATALGAAILALAAIQNKSPNELAVNIDIGANQVESDTSLDIRPYLEKFLQLVGSE
jgi:sugar (pentulose or hexulose) kinase